MRRRVFPGILRGARSGPQVAPLPVVTPRHAWPQGGFSLIEVMVAVGLLAALGAGVAQVFALAERGSRIARVQTLAAVFAAQKMEQLRSLTFAHAPGGSLLSDASTDLAADPPAAGGRGLQRAPEGSLEVDVPFYVDYLGPGGARASSRDGAAFIRRWPILPFDADPDNLLVLQVRVVTVTGGDSRLVSLKARRP